MKLKEKPKQYILTGDIGGAHITTAICDIASCSIIPYTCVRIEISSHESAEYILKAWQTAFSHSLNKIDVTTFSLGIAMPGPFDYQNGISYIKGLNKFEALYGLNIKDSLAKYMDMQPSMIRFRNDAEATIAGEAMVIKGLRNKKVVGITLGTGFGSAFYKNGITNDLDLGSQPFLTSIADDHLSTRWFLKRYRQLSGIQLSGVKELADLADVSEVAQHVFDEFANNMAQFLIPYLGKFQPDVLVICGSIAQASGLFLPRLQENMPDIKIVVGKLGDHAALLGAAVLFNKVTPD
jgi:glucokinase